MSLNKFKDDLKKEAISMASKKLKEYSDKPLSPNRSGTGGDNAKYGAVCLVDGKLVLKSNEHPCHAFMKYYERPLVVFNRFCVRPGSNPKAVLEYFNWIVGHESPWEKFYGKDISHASDAYLEGWIWSELEKHPANLQHSFLVASRMPAEWPQEIDRWYKYISKGIPKAMAFVFLDCFKPEGTLWKVNQANKYDWPLDIVTSSEETVLNFSTGKVEALLRPFSEVQAYKPVNRIFGPNELSIDKGYPSQLFQMYSKTFGMSDTESKKYYTGKTSFAPWNHPSYWTVTEDEMLEIMCLESKRLSI